MFPLQDRIETLLARPRDQLGRGARFLRNQIDLWRFCARRLHENNLGAMSAALSFRTIFALIPMLVLIFLGLKSMGVIEDGKRALREVLDTSGFAQVVAIDREASAGTEAPVGEETPRVITAADQIEELVDNVEQQLTFERIGPIGALVMIWTAMTLLTTLESSLNRIFGAPRDRPLTERVIMFWSTLTLGPILIMAAIFAGQGAMQVATTLPLIGGILAALGWLMPAVVGILVVAAGYKLIPNTRVGYRAALGGAIVAVPAWMVARWAFAIYVQQFVVQGNLYGVLGLLPLFLLWLNVSWSIFLFGAELAHTASSLTRLQRTETAEQIIIGPSDWLAIMVSIARRHLGEESPATRDDLVEDTGLPGQAVERMLSGLVDAELLAPTSGKQRCYLLTHSPERVTLQTILQLGDPRQCSDEPEGLWKDIGDSQAASRVPLAETTLAGLAAGSHPPRKLTLARTGHEPRG